MYRSYRKVKINPSKNEKNITYGQAVHRYEFGIYKGTFWSPLGNKMAFYRKDENKVDNYPVISVIDTTSTIENIKYPNEKHTRRIVPAAQIIETVRLFLSTQYLRHGMALSISKTSTKDIPRIIIRPVRT